MPTKEQNTQLERQIQNIIRTSFDLNKDNTVYGDTTFSGTVSVASWAAQKSTLLADITAATTVADLKTILTDLVNLML